MSPWFLFVAEPRMLYRPTGIQLLSYKEHIMAKGQLRGNKEAKKPKQPKKPATADTPFGAIVPKGSAQPAGGKKK
ncbi:hypothetical protein CKA81_02705 [Pollutimonas thiosulfatoxidans]|uniref:Uncharacterized protein n=1 Tax=Pollutimonas thiosulfatoxidans TaxID=2028345 RepID=A0A410G984_9BURK|nr:hypothetical protein CKA81_02705 [Pollutimonas thiosulfatoxidans]